MHTASRILSQLAWAMAPLMPQTAERIRRQLGVEATSDVWEIDPELAGREVALPEPLFARVEPDSVAELQERFRGTQEAPALPALGYAIDPSIDYFSFVVELSGLAVAVHAIGDRTNRELITVFEQHTGRNMRSVPHRIEHLQIIRPGDVERLARLGIAASVQPIHVTDDIPLCDTSIGSRSCFAYPFREMLDAGVTLALGSDAPVADPNPLWGIHAAVTRQERDGTPEGGWYPQQRLTVHEAVSGFTMGPAIVSGREATLGSIAPGKLADLAVLDRDIFAIEPMEIHRAQVVRTVFDGQVVYEQ